MSGDGCCGPFVPGSGGGGGGGGDGGVALSAGTQSVSTGTVAFADSNGLSFGMSGSSQITASFDGIRSVSAGTTNALGPGVSFANGGGVSFGAAGSTITASVASQTPETPFAISAGTQSVSTGTAVFSNANNVTFGMAGSQTITALASVAAIKTISAGTTNATGQAISFANGSGVSFGFNGNTLTASVAVQADFSYSMYQPWAGQSLSFINPGQSSLHIQPRTVPNVVFSQLNQLVSWQANVASIGTGTLSIDLGVYTKTAGSLSLLMSTLLTATVNHSLAINDSLNSGIRLITSPWTSTISRGDYWFGHLFRSTFSSNNGSFRMGAEHALQPAAFSGYLGQPAATSVQEQLGLGVFSAQTAALPTSIAFSEINGSAVSSPYAFAFGSTV